MTISYRLGLDVGANSLGWAAVQWSGDLPVGVLRAGVRIFEAGVIGNIEQGREESRAAKRRQMRLQRRQTDRRRWRLRKVYNLLVEFGLLPAAPNGDRTAALNALDASLAAQYGAADIVPYFLRARALDEKLETLALGRVFYHLAQRRGFLSNRKARARESEDDRGKVKQGIADLWARIQASGARTLGEYFARLDPHRRPGIRRQWTERRMFQEEFAALWDAQVPHYPEILTAPRRAALCEAMFHQRPLDEQDELIGECELLPPHKRAPMWHPLAQRFRLLQAVNDLRLLDPAGAERALSEPERQRLLQTLDEDGDLAWSKVRKLLGIARRIEINRERGGETRLVGNRTGAKLRLLFGEDWGRMTSAERLEAAADLCGKLSEEPLRQKAIRRWNFGEFQAAQYAETHLEEGKYLALSVAALERLLPRMERGESYMTARLAEFPEKIETGAAVDLLPPVASSLAEIRNPAVLRALTEVRKVVNALLREYGKPEEIHIELARDLKSGREERERRWKHTRAQEKRREEAAARIVAEDGPQQVSRAAIEWMLLAMECHFQCPYTGRSFSYQSKNNGQVQVEHIVPFSRSLDDSYLHKTLCYADENARKGNRTPWEYYGRAGHPEWEAILDRVRNFDSPVAAVKARRFQMQEAEVDSLLDDFSSRQLNDTRYASRLAARYLAQLYGGVWDADRQRIVATGGGVTAYLRRLWSLNAALGDDRQKNRGDHRQHAVDAIVVALTGPTWVKRLADAAERAREAGRSRFASLPAPWDGFAADVKNTVTRVIVSHRPERSLGGAFHDESFYGYRRATDGEPALTIRKPVESLSPGDLERIVDPCVRERVRLQLGIVGGDAKKLAVESNRPTLTTRDGRSIPIRRVRIAVEKNIARAVARGERQRTVIGGDNQHVEVFAMLDKAGEVKKWDCAIVSKQEAARRVAADPREPVVQRDHGPHTRFEFSISKGDILEIGPETDRRLVVVKSLEGDTRVGVVNLHDARPVTTENRNRERYRVNQLMREHKCRKVVLSPLGDVLACHD